MKTTTTAANKANRPFLLLTAAVDARNGAACLFSKEERFKQYLHTFRWYMRFLQKNPMLCRGLVFCENSEADLSAFRALVPEDWKDRVEFISLPMDGFRPEKGKTYNEMRTLDLAMERSDLLGPRDLFIKLTGRYPVRNIRRLAADVASKRDAISVCFFRWPEVRRFGSPHPALCDTRCIAIRKSVWNDCFKGLYKTADNAKHRHFETIAREITDSHAGESGWIQGFSRPPLILGKQGGIKRIAGVAVPKWIEPVLLFATYLLHWKTLRNNRPTTRAR